MLAVLVIRAVYIDIYIKLPWCRTTLTLSS
uniref:Uncharacterized protein n=1 Tax=Anguilla anguilla TaxID=7936 RepID=A0A0E9T6Y6_ANGAN